MTYRPTVLGFLFLGLAVVLAGCEVLGVLEFVSEQQGAGYVVWASCIIAGITPGLPALADWFWRDGRRGYCLSAWVGFLICLSIVLTAAIARTGSATDAGEQARRAAERRATVAAAAEQQAADDYKLAQAAALKECDVRRARCLEAEEKAARAREALAAARAALIAAPAGPQVDPLARRLSAALRIVTEDQVRLMQPLLVPVGLSLLSVLFFAGWSRLDFVGAETGGPAAPLQPLETPQSPAQPVLVAAASLPPPVARAPLPAKVGAVAAFLVSSTEPAPEEAIEIERSLYNAYVAWCSFGGMQALNKAQFALELAKIGKATGLTIEIRGREAYCLDRRLAA